MKLNLEKTFFGVSVAILALQLLSQKKKKKKKIAYTEDNPIYQDGYEEGIRDGDTIGYNRAIRQAKK
tara:strand:+ start:58 stop:258 length:201 start_codon:yes stop_codon:yes gene_type:complete